MLVGQLALVTAAIFTGAAFYINFAEQPARLTLDDRALLAEWKPSYQHGFTMQATLAVVGFIFGSAAWWTTGDERWLAGAVVILANWPFTLIAIMPTNKRILDIPPDKAGSTSRTLITSWGKLHAVRTALGALSTMIFLWALN
jgi:hypothetical protein